ncbi:OmpA-OmpF porin, OOP family [Salinihabitans flavidus]|uniref:OmpA-OmpF porin, OOP family n=1 Tax=Salinihabitans flavidus TaxID=569882 RepID=A0A1H8S9Y9_9RHOB|nr:OmpA family protein [Salinihabitans flavidus]SEO75108.1 OmpA-OmpF porin, OOP family [Salinihabitans flavidus]
MRLSSLAIVIATFALAAIFSLVAASISATVIEDSSRAEVKQALDREGLDWAEVHAEGLQVFIAGTAPSEATRFKAISTAGGVVDAARVIDDIQVEAPKALAAPDYSIEILRNDAGVSLIGLMPESSDRNAILRRMHRLSGDGRVSDFLETAQYDVPEGWDMALSYAMEAMEELPRAKISIRPGRVVITAMSDSQEDRRRLERSLNASAPSGLRLALSISAPRPVITPFALRFVIESEGQARFDACSADTEEARSRILDAARKAGLSNGADCTIGLGVPSPHWAEAAEQALLALAEIGEGSVTFSDADISLVAAESTPQERFDRVTGKLDSALPDLFALHAVLPEPEVETTGTSEFIATLSPEGMVQLRGRLRGDISRRTTESYAHARFGAANVHLATRQDETLPRGWEVRVLAGLDALSRLHNGALRMTPDSLALTGRTGDSEAKSDISRLLSEQLGEGARYRLDVTYEEALDPIAKLPTPEECEARIDAVLAERQITFEPGSGTIDRAAGKTLDQIADILRECGEIRLEIQGHTDSQGREEMNMALSQSRAQSVLSALRDRRILTGSFTAKGYGETMPIADNDTEEGREDNRRIAFVLIKPESAEEAETQDGGETGEGGPSDGDETDPSQSDTDDVSSEQTDSDANSSEVAQDAETVEEGGGSEPDSGSDGDSDQGTTADDQN